jgi:hypothetical protein
MQRAFGIRTFRAWHKAALKVRNGKLSADAAREVIAQGVSHVFTAANIESLPGASIKSRCESSWKPKQSKLSNPHTRVTSA